MSHWLGYLMIYFIFMQDSTHSLRLVEVRIPNYVIKGSAAQLECLYDLDGEALYSVKWYKDGNEFYRYVPRDMPPAQTFLLPGVSVDLHNSSDAIVTLRNVNLQSAGRFRCEVSGEAPSFQTVTEHGDMIVVSLPDQGPPKISGGRPRYQIGDWVRINCTAGRSKPSVQLSWYVNGEVAEPHMLRKYDTIVSGREGLETSVLGLQFRVDQHHFRNGDMKLKCVASLSTFYWRSNEESVEGDRPQKAPVLESRETVYASNSRADPVQASKTDSVVFANAPSLLMLLLPACILSGCFMEQLHLMQHLIVRQIVLCQQQQQQNNDKKQQQKEKKEQEKQEENEKIKNKQKQQEKHKQNQQEKLLNQKQQQQKRFKMKETKEKNVQIEDEEQTQREPQQQQEKLQHRRHRQIIAATVTSATSAKQSLIVDSQTVAQHQQQQQQQQEQEQQQHRSLKWLSTATTTSLSLSLMTTSSAVDSTMLLEVSTGHQMTLIAS